MNHDVGSHAALDFLNTKPDEGRPDVVGTAPELLDWLDAHGLGGDWINESKAQSGRLDQSNWTGLIANARELRQWLRGQLYRPEVEFEPLNQILAEAVFEQGVAPVAKGVYRLLLRDRWTGWRSTLLPLARSMAQLLVEHDHSRIRSCEGDGCKLVFLDLSHGGNRRWCSMADCGTRDKVTAFRARQRLAGQ